MGKLEETVLVEEVRIPEYHDDLALTTISLLIPSQRHTSEANPVSCSCLQVLPPAWPSTANPHTALQSFVQDEVTQLANYPILSPLLSSASSLSSRSMSLGLSRYHTVTVRFLHYTFLLIFLYPH